MAVSYFFPGLSIEESSSLEASGCICAKVAIDREEGYIINEEDLETALERLNLQLKQTDPTSVVGVLRIGFLRSTDRASNAMEALNTVLAQVQKLQAEANLTEFERVERQRLKDEVLAKQRELGTATQRLKSTVAIYEQTAARIQTITDIAASLGTEMAALPAELQSQCTAVNDHLKGLADKLSELANSCNYDKTSAVEMVDQKRAALESAKQALVDDLNKQRVSAEDALADADAALNEAAQISSN